MICLDFSFLSSISFAAALGEIIGRYVLNIIYITMRKWQQCNAATIIVNTVAIDHFFPLRFKK